MGHAVIKNTHTYNTRPHTHTHTSGRTPLHECPAGHTDRYLHNTQQTQKTNIHEPPSQAGFEPAISEIKQMQIYTLDHMATGAVCTGY
jgi:hypothetical protein